MALMITKKSRWLVRKVFQIFAGLVIVAAVILSLLRLSTPWLQAHRQELTDRISQEINVPLSIDAMEVTWRHFSPVLKLEHVALLGPDKKEPLLEIEEVYLGIDLFDSLLHRQLSLGRLVVLNSSLVLTRHADGQFRADDLATLFPSSNDEKSTTESRFLLKSLLALPHLTARDITLDLHDETGELINVVNVDISIQNSDVRHLLSGRINLGEENPGQLKFVLNLQGSVSDLENLGGQFYIRGKNLILADWLKLRPKKGLPLSGVINMTAQGELTQNKLHAIKSQFEVTHFKLGSTSLIDYAAGAVNGSRDGQGYWNLKGQKLALTFNGVAWPETSFEYKVVDDSLDDRKLHFDISYLRLQDITAFLERVKPLLKKAGVVLGEPINRLSTYQPSGELHHVGVMIEHKKEALMQYKVAMQFNNLKVKSYQSTPEIVGLSGTLEADEKGGRIKLDSRNGFFAFPKLFREKLPFDQLMADILWQRQGDRWQIEIPTSQWLNQLAAGHAEMTLELPDGGAATIELLGGIKAQNVKQKDVHRYLPVGILSKDLTQWLDAALQKADMLDATLVLRGPLKDFPFDELPPNSSFGQSPVQSVVQPKGTFLIEATVTGGVLRYASDWPSATQLAGNLRFAGRAMDISIQKGLINNTPISHLQASIADLGAEPAILQITGSAQGSLKDGLAFIDHSPLEATIGRDLSGLEGNGRMALDLQLTIPLGEEDNAKQKAPVTTTVKGHVALQKATLAFPAWNFAANNVNGAFDFTGDGLTADNITGQIFGSPATVSIETQAEATKEHRAMTILTVKGNTSAGMIEKQWDIPLKQSKIAGEFAYEAQLKLRHGGDTKLKITSDLLGLGIKLPAPLNKPAQLGIPSELAIDWDNKKNLQVQFNYGDVQNGIFQWDRKGSTYQFKQGRLHFGKGSPTLPGNNKLLVDGHIEKLSLEEWQEALNSKTTLSMPDLSFLGEINVDIAKLSVSHYVFDNMTVSLSRMLKQWQIALNNLSIQGQILLPDDLKNQPVTANFARFYLPELPAGQQKDTASFSPTKIPALHFTSADVRYGDRIFGNVALDISRIKDGVSIDKLTTKAPTFTLVGSGSWLMKNNQEMSVLRGKVKSTDIQKTLKAWGIPGSVYGKSAHASFDLYWFGALYSPPFMQLNGSVSLEAKQGWIEGLGKGTDTKVGFGRLLNLLSIESLPKRLQLNFSDLTHRGFDFDLMKGDFSLQQGNADTKNMQIKGSVADVDIRGRIGLVAHDYYLQVVVTPDLTSSLPVVATLAGGPVVGALAWVADKVVGTQVNKISRNTYRVTGSWEKPVIVPAGKTAPVR